MLKVKICGITRMEDAKAAIAMGATALGFNFYKKSKRYIKPSDARGIIEAICNEVETVGIFVNASLEEIKDAVSISNINTVQFHGCESVEFCQKNEYPCIKALKLNCEADLEEINKYKNGCRILVDAVSGNQFGGTGKQVDLKLAEKAQSIAPIYLAGGINPENVGHAVSYVKPYGIDLASGVELSPGFKSLSLMQELFNNITS